jgi:hypothetical protein
LNVNPKWSTEYESCGLRVSAAPQTGRAKLDNQPFFSVFPFSKIINLFCAVRRSLTGTCKKQNMWLPKRFGKAFWRI